MKSTYLLIICALCISTFSFGQGKVVSSQKLKTIDLKLKSDVSNDNSDGSRLEVQNLPPDTIMSCFFTYMSVTQGSCNGNNNFFTISGSVEFIDPPTTGQLVFQDCNGNTQVFNAPFASPTNYSMDSIISDGTTTSCNVTAYFTDSSACSMTSLSFDYPSPCLCVVDAGTFSQNLNGTPVTADPITLCFGDSLNINANGDYTPPTDFGALTFATYDPGMWLLIYSCPPTLGPPNAINSDPCLLGIVSMDDQSWSVVNTFGGNVTYWYVPVTMYSMQDAFYAASVGGGPWCYDLGPPYEVTFLDEIGASISTDCVAGTVTATVNGGLSALNGSDFTIQNVLPAYATVSTTTLGSGDPVVIDGLLANDSWSFDVSDTNGCSTTFSGSLMLDASFSYSLSNYCQNDSTVTPTITGLANGMFSAPSQVIIDPNTGEIDLINSTPGGPYAIDYTVSNGLCSGLSTSNINIIPSPILTIQDVIVCQGDSVTLNGSGAQTYVWSGTVLDGAPFLPNSTQFYSVTGTDPLGCSSTDSVLVTVNNLPNPPSITNSGDTTFCVGDSVILTSSQGLGNVWSTGESTPSISVNTTGAYFLIYTDTNGCSSNSDTIHVFVDPLPSVTIDSLLSRCVYHPDHTLVEGAPSGGTYQGIGVITGTIFSPSVAGVGTFAITYVYTDGNSCSNSATRDITVEGCASIEENDANSVVVYPNPINNELIIESNGEFQFEILDVRGRIVDKGNGLDQISLNTTRYQTGVYFVKIQTTVAITTIRILKE